MATRGDELDGGEFEPSGDADAVDGADDALWPVAERGRIRFGGAATGESAGMPNPVGAADADAGAIGGKWVVV